MEKFYSTKTLLKLAGGSPLPGYATAPECAKTFFFFRFFALHRYCQWKTRHRWHGPPRDPPTNR